MEAQVYDYISGLRKNDSTIVLPLLEALEDPYRTILDIIYALTAILALFSQCFRFICNIEDQKHFV